MMRTDGGHRSVGHWRKAGRLTKQLRRVESSVFAQLVEGHCRFQALCPPPNRGSTPALWSRLDHRIREPTNARRNGA